MNLETVVVSAKFMSIPMVPIPSALIPKNHGFTPKNFIWIMYIAVKIIPHAIPVIAPSFVVFLLNIPRTMIGKKLDAASPKANATT